MKQELVARLLLAIVGQAGAGKTSLSKVISHRLNASLVSFGGFVREEALRRGLPSDRQTLQILGQQLIDQLGSETFARQVIMAASGPHDILIVDGVRSTAVWQAVQPLAQLNVLIYLDIPAAVRIERMMHRDQQTKETIQTIMNHPLETHVPELKMHADVMLAEGDVTSFTFTVLSYLIDRGLVEAPLM